MIDLDIRYESQWNVPENPTGSCNVTSLAMCLSAFGIVGDGSCPTLAEQLYLECDRHGLDRHYPEDLARLSRMHGVSDEFTTHGTEAVIKAHLESIQKPVMIHTYLTASGHVVVIKGFDETGWIVHDPYGEWYPDHYDCGCGQGENEHYSYDLIQRTASPEGHGNIWCHFFGG